MKLSERYVITSQVPRYMYLTPDTKSIEGLEFNEEKVYYRRDLVRLSSNIGWIDYGRMVKTDE